MKIFNHKSLNYLRKFPFAYQHRNGAYLYSQELCANIIPRIQTERPWVTINDGFTCWDGAIVFIHNNLHPEHYEWLSEFKDLILVCGIPETCEKVAHLGRAIYLPLSIDVNYVKRFACEDKIYDTAFVGRKSKMNRGEIPEGTPILSNMPRELLLAKTARFKKVYAVGRCALEAKALGCEILPYDERFPDASIWQVIDNADAAKMLQEMLDEIDK